MQHVVKINFNILNTLYVNFDLNDSDNDLILAQIPTKKNF